MLWSQVFGPVQMIDGRLIWSQLSFKGPKQGKACNLLWIWWARLVQSRMNIQSGLKLAVALHVVPNLRRDLTTFS
jgi:hypothetical protein